MTVELPGEIGKQAGLLPIRLSKPIGDGGGLIGVEGTGGGRSSSSFLHPLLTRATARGNVSAPRTVKSRVGFISPQVSDPRLRGNFCSTRDAPIATNFPERTRS